MQRRKEWPIFAGLALMALVGCQQQPPSRWEAAQQESTENPVAVSSEAVAGSEFNRFFPQVERPWNIVFKQEKTGFAQASLQHEGREMAVLSVSDTRNNPEALEKFKTAEQTLDGSPMASIGEEATAVLVGDRYQVQIRSMDPAFGPEEREEWLAKFNLQAISRID